MVKKNQASSAYLRKSTLLLAMALWAACFPSHPAQAADPELTVYNQNFALVKDYRPLTLNSGINAVAIDDVAALIDPTSVHFKSLTAPGGVSVLEQNFQYDLINKQSILNRMVGKKIRFVRNGAVQEGVLLSPATSYARSESFGNPYQNNYYLESAMQFAVQTHQGILLTSLDQILIDELPKGLYARPTLTWRLKATQGGTHQTELSYLTDGLNWFADYIVVLDAEDAHLDLNGWVTLDNQSGASYDNASLKLVAGDVRKIQQNRARPTPMAVQTMKMEAGAEPQFKEQSFFEYHLYTLQGKTDLHNRETKQLSLIQSTGIPARKRYVFDPVQVYYGEENSDVESTRFQKVKTILNLKNSRENHLGMPLPKGRIRVYKADDTGALQFVGEDTIDHTAINENMKLYLGDAFDIVGEKIHLNTRQTGKIMEDQIQVKLRNHKKQAVSVDVIEHPYGNWKIVDNSHSFQKENAQTVVFPAGIPAEGETVLTYTIRTWQP